MVAFMFEMTALSRVRLAMDISHKLQIIRQ